ncbi:hypothetical protein JZ751_015702 [Albula glossodonta]|uniref:Integrin alpha third immunoglobulin-like domain-containing protein n=1 Tax=Albula glossodonta TaxID=121402 RepID=A0A8T2NUB9_9TELE|nr:hypothetical protein JZ751_015702 [Albula glossodonta]
MLQRLNCEYRMENNTRMVVCDLGNPMVAATNHGTKRETWLGHCRTPPPPFPGWDATSQEPGRPPTTLSRLPGRLEEVGPHIGFNLQIQSSNKDNSKSNPVNLVLNISVRAHIDIRGVSHPAQIILPFPRWEPKEEPVKEEDIGPQVQHIYELHNKGPSSVSSTLLEVGWPSRYKDEHLLYALEVLTDGPVTCRANSSLNPLGLENCSNIHCLILECQVGRLDGGQSAVVKIRSRLWAHTFLLIGTFVVWATPDVSFAIPLWVIVLAILLGLLVLAILTLVMWKCGFFDRARPPKDDVETIHTLFLCVGETIHTLCPSVREIIHTLRPSVRETIPTLWLCVRETIHIQYLSVRKTIPTLHPSVKETIHILCPSLRETIPTLRCSDIRESIPTLCLSVREPSPPCAHLSERPSPPFGALISERPSPPCTHLSQRPSTPCSFLPECDYEVFPGGKLHPAPQCMRPANLGVGAPLFLCGYLELTVPGADCFQESPSPLVSRWGLVLEDTLEPTPQALQGTDWWGLFALKLTPALSTNRHRAPSTLCFGPSELLPRQTLTSGVRGFSISLLETADVQSDFHSILFPIGIQHLIHSVWNIPVLQLPL